MAGEYRGQKSASFAHEFSPIISGDGTSSRPMSLALQPVLAYLLRRMDYGTVVPCSPECGNGPDGAAFVGEGERRERFLKGR
jgi:hypothetical protein